MSFLKGNALGACACGCSGANNEYKYVFAGMPYPLGYVRMPTLLEIESGAFGLNPVEAGDTTPDRMYRGWEQTQINSDGSTAYYQKTVLSKYDGAVETTQTIDNSGTTPFDGVQYGYQEVPKAVEWTTNGDDQLTWNYKNGAKWVFKLLEPYTLDQAITEAEGLLDNVALLDHLPTYVNENGGAEFHFCYASESTLYGYYTATTYWGFFVGDGPWGSRVVYTIYEVTRVDGVVTSVDPIYYPENVTGVFEPPVSLHQLAAAYNPIRFSSRIWISKMASKHAQLFNFRTDWLRDPATLKLPDYYGFNGVNWPVSDIPQGETIFLHTDVPGVGWSIWFNGGSLIAFPGAGNTETGAGNAIGAGGSTEPI